MDNDAYIKALTPLKDSEKIFWRWKDKDYKGWSVGYVKIVAGSSKIIGIKPTEFSGGTTWVDMREIEYERIQP